MAQKSEWITDWNKIEDAQKYIVCPIAAKELEGGELYLQRPSGVMLGWEVKRLLRRCYAALPMPEFLGLEPPSTTDKETHDSQQPEPRPAETRPG